MEQMKVSSIIRAYPNAFVLAQAVKRNAFGAIEMANVMSVCHTKQEAFTNQVIFRMVGVKTFLIPTFEEPEEAVHIIMSKKEYKTEPLLSPSDYAMIFRQYYDMDWYLGYFFKKMNKCMNFKGSIS